jgi:hypothetical protein
MREEEDEDDSDSLGVGLGFSVGVGGGPRSLDFRRVYMTSANRQMSLTSGKY